TPTQPPLGAGGNPAGGVYTISRQRPRAPGRRAAHGPVVLPSCRMIVAPGWKCAITAPSPNQPTLLKWSVTTSGRGMGAPVGPTGASAGGGPSRPAGRSAA